MKLEGKIALVTGGSHGIGRGISLALAREGAKVVVNYSTDSDAAQWTENKIKEMGGEAAVVKADVGEIDQCKELVSKSNEAFGHVDLLVSNAGIGQQSKIVDTPDEEWDRVMNVNLRATFALARELMPGMIEREYGRIVTISSNCALTGIAQGSFVTYATSKGALNTLTKGIAHEGAPFITCNAICPGGTNRKIAEERGEKWPPPPPPRPLMKKDFSACAYHSIERGRRKISRRQYCFSSRIQVVLLRVKPSMSVVAS